MNREITGWHIVLGIVGIVVVVWLALLALALAYCVIAFICFMLIAVLDQLFGCGLASTSPPVMWAISGALFGSALGFWTIVPVYGWRRMRRYLIALPMVVILLFAAMGGVSRSTDAYSSTELIDPSWSTSISPQANGSTEVKSANLPHAAQKISIVGHWTGRFGYGYGSELDIDRVKGSDFFGSITSPAPYGILKTAFKGHFESDDVHFTITETKYLHRDGYENSSLGSYSGYLEDADTIKGRINDGYDKRIGGHDLLFKRASKVQASASASKPSSDNSTAKPSMTGVKPASGPDTQPIDPQIAGLEAAIAGDQRVSVVAGEWTGTAEGNGSTKEVSVSIPNGGAGTFVFDTNVYYGENNDLLQAAGSFKDPTRTVKLHFRDSWGNPTDLMKDFVGRLARDNKTMFGTSTDGHGKKYEWKLTKKKEENQ